MLECCKQTVSLIFVYPFVTQADLVKNVLAIELLEI